MLQNSSAVVSNITAQQEGLGFKSTAQVGPFVVEINGIVVSKNVFGVTEPQVSSELCVCPQGPFQVGPTKSSRMPRDVTVELCIDGLTPWDEFQRKTNIVLVTLLM